MPRELYDGVRHEKKSLTACACHPLAYGCCALQDRIPNSAVVIQCHLGLPRRTERCIAFHEWEPFCGGKKSTRVHRSCRNFLYLFSAIRHFDRVSSPSL